RHVLLQLVPVAVSLGTAPEWMGTVVDVDDRRRAEEALAAEKERLLVTLRSIGEGVVTTDIEGRCRLLNPVAERLTGWRQEEALGQALSTWFRVFTRDQHAPMDQTFLHALQGQQVQVTQPLLLEDRAGLQRLVQASAAPIMDGARIVGMVLVFRDVTLQTRVEEDFIKHQKLESIGVLAGGIAHDFNNVLTAILGNVSLARLYAEPGSRVTQILGEAERAFWRARDLTHQLLTFAKGGAPVRQTRDIRPVLVESAKLGLAGSNVRSILELAADLWPVDFDEGQISQVVNNLVINAKQAMPEGGSVCLRAVNLSLAQDNEVSLPAGRYVRISVEDEGIGIPKEHLLNIFDPYFTTKQGGSGLGLATAYSIIRRHDGFVRVTSEPGCGARFDVYLPASGHSLAAPAEPLSAVSAGGGRILVMDDEAMVREVAAQLLAHLGYRVEAAANGEQALTLYAEALAAGDRFDAVLLDLTVIGGMGGRECIGHLRALDPGVRAVASSGYSSAGSLADYRQQGFDQVIEKPYDLAVLARTMALAVSAGDTTDAL
ncbi:MAG TPA: ATP-binding protein, partial [Acidiferrobacteraceae bacterium]|nr:ATP-binding protein [Acidiferrobacteraceae bacterium]